MHVESEHAYAAAQGRAVAELSRHAERETRLALVKAEARLEKEASLTAEVSTYLCIYTAMRYIYMYIYE